MFLAEVNYLFILGGLFAIIIVMILVIYLFETASYLKLYRALPSNLGKAIYGYLDKNGDLVSFSDELYTLINVPKGKNLKKAIKAIYFENEKITFKKFLELLKTKNGTINFVFEIDEETHNVTLKKSKVLCNDKLIGYALMEQSEEFKTDNAKEFMEMIDELEAPCAYYYGKSKDTNFSINHTLQVLLASKDRKMTYDGIKKYVFEEDLEKFFASVNENANDIRTQYRLLTTQGLMSFEEVKKFNDGKVTSIIMHIETIDEKVFIENQELDVNINNLIEEGTNFGGVIVSFKSLMDNEIVISKNIIQDVIKKYFKIVRKEMLSIDDIIGKINEFEYVIIIKDIEKLNSFVNNICNENTPLLKYELTFCGQLININNKLGISYYNDLMKTKKDFYSSLYQALSLANNSEYEKDYSIYTPAKEEKINDEYSFDKYKIDIDNSFLHEDK